MNRIRGVIFDMDGLMFDTERMFTDAWPGVCAQFGLEYQPQMAASLRGSNGAKSGAGPAASGRAQEKGPG